MTSTPSCRHPPRAIRSGPTSSVGTSCPASSGARGSRCRRVCSPRCWLPRSRSRSGSSRGTTAVLSTDAVMRLNDAALAFPYLIIAVVLSVILGPSLLTATVAIGIVQAPKLLRVTRGEVLSLREEEFVAGRDRGRRARSQRDVPAHPSERLQRPARAGHRHAAVRDPRGGHAVVPRVSASSRPRPPGA